MSDHQSFRPSDILRYSQIISDYQTVSTSDLQIFSDYFRPSFYQIVRTADPQIFSDYQTISTSDLQIFSDYFRPSSYQIVRIAGPQIFSDYFRLSDS